PSKGENPPSSIFVPATVLPFRWAHADYEVCRCEESLLKVSIIGRSAVAAGSPAACSALPLVVATRGAINVTTITAIQAGITANVGFRVFRDIYVDQPQTAYLDLIPQIVLL